MSGKKLVADGMIHVKDFQDGNKKFLVLIKTPDQGKYTMEIQKQNLDCAVHTIHVDDFVNYCGVTDFGNAILYKTKSTKIPFIIEFGVEIQKDEIIQAFETKKIPTENDPNIYIDLVDMENISIPDTSIGTYENFTFSMFDYTRLSSHVWLSPTITDFMMYYYLKKSNLEVNHVNSIFLAKCQLFEDFKVLKNKVDTNGKITQNIIDRVNAYTEEIDIFKDKKHFYIPTLTDQHFRLVYVKYSDDTYILC